VSNALRILLMRVCKRPRSPKFVKVRHGMDRVYTGTQRVNGEYFQE